MQRILTFNINELNDLIYAGAKLVNNKIDIPQRNPKRNPKPGWEMRLERQIKKMPQAKLLGKVKHTGTQRKKDPKKTTAEKSDNTSERNKSKDICERRKTQKVPGQG